MSETLRFHPESEIKPQRRLVETQTNHDSGAKKIRAYEYDDEGKVVAKRDRLEQPDGKKKMSTSFLKAYKWDRGYEYNENGNVVKETLRYERQRTQGENIEGGIRVMGYEREFVRDDHGRVVLRSQRSLRGEIAGGKEDLGVGVEVISEIMYEYDEQGNVVKEISENAESKTTTTRSFDDQNQLIEQTKITEKELSDNGFEMHIPDRGTRVRFEYDDQGRLKTKHVGNLDTERDYGRSDYSYSEDGKTTAYTYFWGEKKMHTLTQTTDEDGHVVKVSMKYHQKGDKKGDYKKEYVHKYE